MSNIMADKSTGHSMACSYPEGCTCAAREWYRGYACAVAQILHTHGDEVVARDVMNAGGRDLLTFADADDLEIINQHRLTAKRAQKANP